MPPPGQIDTQDHQGRFSMTGIKIGDPSIPFRLPGVDGSMHALEDHTMKRAVVVIFSCNHCPYVQAWEDRMIAIQAEYGPKGVQLLAINPNDENKYPEDGFEAMKARARDRGFNFPYLRDETQEIARAYGAERTPEVFLLDAAGALRYHGLIDDNYDDPAAVAHHHLRDALDALLTDVDPPTRETQPVGCTIKWK
jgi:peroxiredoxin